MHVCFDSYSEGFLVALHEVASAAAVNVHLDTAGHYVGTFGVYEFGAGYRQLAVRHFGNAVAVHDYTSFLPKACGSQDTSVIDLFEHSIMGIKLVLRVITANVNNFSDTPVLLPRLLFIILQTKVAPFAFLFCSGALCLFYFSRMKLFRLSFFSVLILVFSLLLQGCGSVERSVRRGDAAMGIGEYCEAAAQYKRAYARVPAKERTKRGQVAYKMADAYRRYGNSARALGAFRNAARYGMGDTLTHYYIGELLRLQGDYEADIKTFERIEAEALQMADYMFCGIVRQCF